MSTLCRKPVGLNTTRHTPVTAINGRQQQAAYARFLLHSAGDYNTNNHTLQQNEFEYKF